MEKQYNTQLPLDLLAHLSDTIYLLDLSLGKTLFLNKEEFCGYTRKELESPQSILHAVHPDDQEALQRHWQNLLTKVCEGSSNIEYRLRNKDNDWEWINSREVVLEYDENKNPKILLITLRTITKQKVFEQEIQSEKEYVENLIETANAMVIGLDVTGNITVFNQTAEEITGYSRTDLIHKNWFEVLVPKDRYPQVWEIFEELIQKGIPKNFENPILTKGGKEKYILWRNSELRKNKEIIGTISFGIDITEQKKVEDSLRESEHYLMEAQSIAKIGHWKLHPATMTVEGSDELFKIFELSRDEATLQSFVDIVHPEDREYDLYHIQRGMETGEPWDIEHRLQCKDGRIKHVHAIGEAVKDETGKVALLIGTVQDITERKKAEEELRVSKEKLQTTLHELEKLKQHIENENRYLREEIKLAHNFGDIIGRSAKMKQMLSDIEQVASTETTVLVVGETGTGKELVARAIHSLSNRKNSPLVKVNCAALPANLIESELFGHEKGAFTGATKQTIGRFELANGGTLFLDEIGDFSVELQAKLLRVLQDGEFERIGNPTTISVDVRIIAATNRDLDKSMSEGNFRQDLYYRLHVFPVQCPPLRERKEDISVLVQHFLHKYSIKAGKEISSISLTTIKALEKYDWPGNVRELENIIERAVITSPGKKLTLGPWFNHPSTTDGTKPPLPLQEYEKEYIVSILERTNWRIRGEQGAAKLLGLKPTTLESRMEKLSIKR